MNARNLLFFLLFPLQLFSQIRLTDQNDLVKPDSHLYILKSDREIEASEVHSLSHEFVQNHNADPNLGLSKYSIWVTFVLHNTGQSTNYLLDVAYPLLDDVELYQVDSSGNLQTVAHFGVSHKFDMRTYQHPNYIFDIHLLPSQKQQYYLRVKSAEQIILPITIGKPTQIWEKLTKENVLIGGYLGVVLIMAIYNFLLFLSVKDYAYLYYVIYIVFLGLTQLGIVGFNYQWLWPNWPEWETISIILFACISSMAVLFFSDRFLDLKVNAPDIRWVLLSLFILFMFSFLSTALGYPQFGFHVMQITTSIETVVLIVTSLYMLKKKYNIAKYFFAAWFVLLIGSFIFLLKDYGILPYNLFTSNSFRLASAAEMGLLSFALAARINILKKENEISQARELAVSLENERLIREQNIVLEQKVEERTRELTESNESLQTTLLHLKEAQSQLVESEKMASLGQLTAGVAHEINNPINFIAANVGPLKRDVQMILDVLENVEDIALNEQLSTIEKKQYIEEQKEEIDLEYLKTEVDFLLKGMQDGTNRTTEIVRSLRIFSRVDEDTLILADLHEGLESTLVILRSSMKDKIQVEKRYHSALPLVECHAGKINQVFLNILTNAIYAIDKKFEDIGGKLLIETGIAEDPAYVFISIKDNGIGIPDEIKERIFDPFFTTKTVGEGTGLGMSITYKTIDKHHGRILVDSVEGEYTVFTLLLPIKQSMPYSGL